MREYLVPFAKKFPKTSAILLGLNVASASIFFEHSHDVAQSYLTDTKVETPKDALIKAAIAGSASVFLGGHCLNEEVFGDQFQKTKKLNCDTETLVTDWKHVVNTLQENEIINSDHKSYLNAAFSVVMTATTIPGAFAGALTGGVVGASVGAMNRVMDLREKKESPKLSLN